MPSKPRASVASTCHTGNPDIPNKTVTGCYGEKPQPGSSTSDPGQHLDAFSLTGIMVPVSRTTESRETAVRTSRGGTRGRGLKRGQLVQYNETGLERPLAWGTTYLKHVKSDCPQAVNTLVLLLFLKLLNNENPVLVLVMKSGEFPLYIDGWVMMTITVTWRSSSCHKIWWLEPKISMHYISQVIISTIKVFFPREVTCFHAWQKFFMVVP